MVKGKDVKDIFAKYSPSQNVSKSIRERCIIAILCKINTSELMFSRKREKNTCNWGNVCRLDFFSFTNSMKNCG